MRAPSSYCGRVALAGRTNAGKSSLLNAIVERKVSVATARPQTTRTLIYGIVTRDNRQAIYVDTPGVAEYQRSTLNRMMHRQMLQGILGADLAVLVIDARHYDERDFRFLALLDRLMILVVLAKTDLLKHQDALLPLAAMVQEKASGRKLMDIFPVSVLKGEGLEPLKRRVMELLPPAPLIYDQGKSTLSGEEFMVCELLREQLFRSLHKELPFSLCVVCDGLSKKKILFVSLSVLVVKESHKPIVLGSKGNKMKLMATLARKEMECFFSQKIMLRVRVKVDKNWSRRLMSETPGAEQ